jgi:V/A-type H+-transporting ATPase subunit F
MVMGAVGERDTVQAFKTLGMRVAYAQTKEEITKALFNLVNDNVPVILITERAAQKVPEALERYRHDSGVIIVPVPGSCGANGFGLRRIRTNIEKAIGADILLADGGKEGK